MRPKILSKPTRPLGPFHLSLQFTMNAQPLTLPPCSGDPFDDFVLDPAHANAMTSSLWELQLLKQHADRGRFIERGNNDGQIRPVLIRHGTPATL